MGTTAQETKEIERRLRILWSRRGENNVVSPFETEDDDEVEDDYPDDDGVGTGPLGGRNATRNGSL